MSNHIVAKHHPDEIEAGSGSLLTTEQLAARWRMSPKTLRNWRVSGRGPVATIIGSLVRYDLALVERYEREHQAQSTAQVR